MQRRYYITSLDHAHEHRDLFHTMAGTHYLCLYDPSVEGARAAWEAKGKPILLSACFRLEAHADRWHDHPQTTILPDHRDEGTHPLHTHLAKPTRKLRKEHLDALASIGVAGHHTVLDLEERATALHRSMKLRSVL